MAKSKTDKKFLRSTVAWAMLAGLAGTAYAQETEQPPAEPADQAQEQSEDEAIVVTGSRLRTNEFSSSSPVQVITTEEGRLAGTSDVAELLQSSTLAAGSPQNDATISSAFVTEGGPGSQTISLRGLGANRTLVLVNGRRGGPAGTRGQVAAFDLNVVPFSVVDRFEILKDGASSVYGSDAVAGVVNIITRREMDGGEVNGTVSQPFEAGGEEYRFDASYGQTFDNGFFTVSFDYYKQEPLAFGDREYTDCREDYTYDAAGDRDDRIDPRTGRPACLNLLSGHVWMYEFSSGDPTSPWRTGGALNSPGGQTLIQWDPDGTVAGLIPGSVVPTSPLNPDDPTVPAGFVGLNRTNRAMAGALNGNPEALRASTLIPDIERYNLFLQGAFDLGANAEAYGEVLLSRRQSRTEGFRQFWTFLYTEDLGDPFNTGWGGVAILSPTAVTDHNSAEQIVNYYRGVAGARGTFGGWLGALDWDIYVQASRSDAEYSQDVILNDAVTAREFLTTGCAGTNLPVSGRPCIDINWLAGPFLNGVFTQAERDFLFDTETGTTVYDQIYGEASIAGDIFSLPAGNVGGVLGVHVRRDEIEDTPGAVTLAGNSWGQTSAGITAGDDTTSEVFGEVRVPLLRGAPFFEELTLTGSGRYTDVESYGSDSTYKLGLNWQINSDWRIRATQGTSFRAPALFEQFLENQTSFVSQNSIDPCIQWQAALDANEISQQTADNCAAAGIPNNFPGAAITATVITGGGNNLKAETSEAFTVGLIWTPSFIDLSVAIDYYEIEVNDEVAVLSASAIVNGCYSSPNFATEPLCDLFDRAPAGSATEFQIDNIEATYLNIASQQNRGIDLTVLYRHELPFGDLSVQGQVTYQLEDVSQLLVTLPEVDANGRIGDPEWVGNLDLRLDSGDWTYYWGVDYVGDASDAEIALTQNAAGTRFYKVDTEATVYHTASIGREFDTWDIRLGVSNVFDEHPPAITAAGFHGGSGSFGVSAAASQYDYVGRTAFVTVGKRF